MFTTMSSVVLGEVGVMESVGAGGGVLIVRIRDVDAVRPALSVAVTNTLCTPALRLLWAKEMFPLESEPFVEKMPSMLDSQESEMSLAMSSGSLTCAEKGTDSRRV